MNNNTTYEELEKKVLELEKQVDMFNLFMEYSPFYVFFKDQDIKTLSLSKNYEKMLGMPMEKLIGKTMDDLFPSDLAKSMIDDDKKILREGQPFEIIEEFNGTTYYTLKFPIIRKDKQPLLAGFTIDITEKRKVEQALQDSEEKMRLFIENFPGATFIKDEKFKTLLASKQLEKIISKEHDEIINKTNDEIFPKSIAEKFNRDDQQVLQMKNGESLTIEEKFDHKEFLTVKYPVHYKNKSLVCGLSVEITNQKLIKNALVESERRFRELMENVKLLSVMLDIEGNITFCNDFLLNLTGWQRQEIIGLNWFEIFTPDNKIVEQNFHNSIDNGNITKTYENDILTKNGEKRIIKWNNTIHRDLEGTIVGTASIGEDITDRLLIEKKLIKTSNQLEATLNALPDLLFEVDIDGIIHEYRTPAPDMLYVSPEKFLGKNLEDILPGSVTEVIKRALDKASIVGEHHGEVYMLEMNKKQEWYELSIAAKEISLLEKQHFVVLVRKITDRKQAEQALLESEEKYRQLIEQSVDGIVMIDGQGIIIDWNLGMYRNTGYSKDEVINKPVWEIQDNLVFGNDKNSGLLDRLKSKWEMILSGEIFEVLGQLASVRHKNGTKRIIEDNLFRIKTPYGYLVCSIQRDVTQRKNTEDALLASEQKYRLLADNVLDVIWKFDVNSGRFTYISPSVFNLRGYTVEEAIEQTMQESLSPESNQYIVENLPKRLAMFYAGDETAKTMVTEVLQPCKNGTNVWVEVLTTFLTGSDGKVNEILGVSRNIEQRKKAERALIESEEKFRNAFQFASFGMALVNTGGKFLQVNSSVCNLFGYSQEELLTKTFMDITHPEDINKGLDLLKELLEKKRDYFWDEKRYIHKNNQIIWALISTSMVRDIEGNALYMITQIQDITENKRAEEELNKNQTLLRTLIDSLPLWLACLDKNGKFLIANKMYSETYIKPLDEIEGYHFSKFLSPKRAEIRHQLLTECLSGKAITWNEEVESEKGTNYITGTCTPLSDKDNNIWGLSIAAIDITKQKSMEIELLNYTEKLKKANETKDKFFSIISHDLRNPFGTIIGYSELLSRSIRDLEYEKSEEFVDQILSLSRYTYNLLENLLNWAKSQSNEIPYYPANVSLSFIFQDICENLSSLAKSKNIKLSYFLADEIIVMADYNMLNTIISNLIVNAIKYTHLGGIVKLFAINLYDAVEITISDNGIGIAEDVKNKLFIAGENPSSKGTSNERGTGLGLILCKEFVEKHGGTIWVKSTVNKGSDFKFTIPFLLPEN